MNLKKITLLLNIFLIIFLCYKALNPPIAEVVINKVEQHSDKIFKTSINVPEISDFFYIQRIGYIKNMVDVYQNGKPLNHFFFNFDDTQNIPRSSFSVNNSTLYFTPTNENFNPDVDNIFYTISHAKASNNLLYALILSCISLLILLLSCHHSLKETFSILFLQPHHASRNFSHKKIFIITIFMITFLTSLLFLYEKNDKWEIFDDTYSYLNHEYTDPWSSLRPPGYRMFLDTIGIFTSNIDAPTFHVLDLVNYYKSNPDKNNALQIVIAAQLIIFSLALGTLSVALTTVLPLALSFALPLISISLTGTSRTDYIMPETITQALIVFVMSFLIFYTTKKKLKYLYIAVVLTIYGFLLKPALIVLVAIVGFVILFEFLVNLKNKPQAKTFFILGCTLTIATIFFPLYLYLQSGIVTLGQLSFITKSGEMIAFGKEEHASAIKYDDLKKVYLNLLEKRKAVDEKLDKEFFADGRENYSPTRIFMDSFNYYTPLLIKSTNEYRAIKQARKPEFKHKTGQAIPYAISEEMFKYVRPLVINERKTLYWHSFLSCFGLINDMRLVSPLLFNLQPSFLDKFIFPVMLLTIFVAFFISSTKIKWILFIISSVHILSVTATSIGHGPLLRYLLVTEWTMLLAFFVSFYFIVQSYLLKKVHC